MECFEIPHLRQNTTTANVELEHQIINIDYMGMDNLLTEPKDEHKNDKK